MNNVYAKILLKSALYLKDFKIKATTQNQNQKNSMTNSETIEIPSETDL
jgi:hypothetical protein